MGEALTDWCNVAVSEICVSGDGGYCGPTYGSAGAVSAMHSLSSLHCPHYTIQCRKILCALCSSCCMVVWCSIGTHRSSFGQKDTPKRERKPRFRGSLYLSAVSSSAGLNIQLFLLLLLWFTVVHLLGGKRTCIGNLFGVLEVKATLSVVYRYHVMRTTQQIVQLSSEPNRPLNGDSECMCAHSRLIYAVEQVWR